jgi:hypothetical protein
LDITYGIRRHNDVSGSIYYRPPVYIGVLKRRIGSEKETRKIVIGRGVVI